MRNYERTIKIAFDVVSKSIIDAELVLKNTQDAFALRKQYNEQKIKPICCECQQELVVSHSRYDRVYFKHKPNHNFCILIDEKLSPNEQEVFISNLQSKESPRHKELKNKIGRLLASEDGVDVSSINVDNHFITITNEKRKPDVYCEYNKYKIAFEIQISKLSQKYILSRHNFYKKNGIFLIWILDNFNIHNQTGLERDIKYLNEYQNFFKLDERTESFKLICDFKKSYLTESNQLRTKWINESITLGQLKFNNQIYQAFFYNFDENYKNNEIFQIQKEKAIIEAKAEINSKKELLISTQKVENIISKIAKLKNNPDKSRQAESLKFLEYSKLSSMIEFEFTQQEYALLNQKLQFKEFELKHHFSIITYFLQRPEKFDYAFINFILSCTKINFNTRLNDQNDISIFQNIFMHQYRHYEDLVKKLLLRNYQISDKDIIFLEELPNPDKFIISNTQIYKIYKRNNNTLYLNDILKFHNLLFIIESARIRKIVGFNYKTNEWIAFANNAITHYSSYWEYIEFAFKKYNLWDYLIKLDSSKGTFQRKLQELYSSFPEQKYDFEEIFQTLYPELI